MNANADFLPNNELAKFITMQVVRPELEAFRDRGHPLEAEIVFIAQNQRKKGPKLTAVGRVVHVSVEIRCRSILASGTYVRCRCRLLEEIPPSSDESFEWDLTAQVLKGHGGFEAIHTVVSPKTTPEGQSGAE